MINLYALCEDLKNEHSHFKVEMTSVIEEIYSFLKHSSEDTQRFYAEWQKDFLYIYGDISTNLSSNSKLNTSSFLKSYHLESNSNKSDIENVQLLFFSIQTYFTLLIKYIMYYILQDVRNLSSIEYIDIILGDFAVKFGIKNYCYEDWYCWPVFELPNGFSTVMSRIYNSLVTYHISSSQQCLSYNNDYIKQIYEIIIPRELRHALGEFYTPDWLAEAIIKEAVPDIHAIKELKMIDPTCGSGTFLFKAIAMKQESGCSLNEILDSVAGLDINPLAILTAKTNYILSILKYLDGYQNIEIPIYNADILKLKEATSTEKSASLDACDRVRFNIQKDRDKARIMKQADIIIGNPPWVNWEYLPEQYRVGSQHLWIEYGLFSAKGRDLSFSKEDISVLITYIVMDYLLKPQGILGFVIRQGVFKSAQNGVGFRKFSIRGTQPVKVIKVEDLSQIQVFNKTSTSAAIFLAQKGEATQYPVPYSVWKKSSKERKQAIDDYSELSQVLSQIEIIPQYAIPAVKEDLTSIWVTAERERLVAITKALGTNSYRARTGVFTGGANAVYWLRINGCIDNHITVSNIVERAKRKVSAVSVQIEDTFVYPMVKGSNVKKWQVTYDTYLLCPHTVETKMWPVPQEQLALSAPQTMDYLLRFKTELADRNGFAGWEKEIQKQEFHAILRIGEYTFSKYKVVWRYIASEFICAVISTVEDPYLGSKLLIPNEKIMYVSLDDEMEAYYLCGILSSSVVSTCVKSYMNPTSISAHVLNKLNIPQYNPQNPIHIKIAQLCKKGHHEGEVDSFISAIDELINSIY